MRFDAFEARAGALWAEIPEEYKAGVEGLVVERDALPHPTHPEVYTLGECLTEVYPSDYGGPETIRSAVVLYHGSFVELSRLDPAFEFEEELWETLTHELRHHLESLASEDALEAVDYAVDQNTRRLHGEPFDPFFYRSGEEVAEGVYRAEREFFLEVVYRGDRAPDPVEFGWHGARYRVPPPERSGDIAFVRIDGGVDVGPSTLELVLVRRRGLLASIRALITREPPEITQVAAVAGRVDEAGNLS